MQKNVRIYEQKGTELKCDKMKKVTFLKIIFEALVKRYRHFLIFPLCVGWSMDQKIAMTQPKGLKSIKGGFFLFSNCKRGRKQSSDLISISFLFSFVNLVTFGGPGPWNMRETGVVMDTQAYNEYINNVHKNLPCICLLSFKMTINISYLGQVY